MIDGRFNIHKYSFFASYILMPNLAQTCLAFVKSCRNFVQTIAVSLDKSSRDYRCVFFKMAWQIKWMFGKHEISRG